MMKFKDLEIDGHNDKWKEAVASFRDDDKAGALFLFKRLAKEGCAPALVEIGNIYEKGGTGVDRDVDKAIEWYGYSVDVLDDPKAHLALGRLYLQSSDKDVYKKAYFHFSLLEPHGEMGALYGLGLIYELGLGVVKDNKKALNYYELASALGHVLARKNIARILIKKSFIKGFFMWVKTSIQVWRLVSKNPGDGRLGIS